MTPHPSYFKALTLPTTTIIRDNIERFTPDGIIAGGVERKCDVIIKAIGFNVEYTPRFEVTGKDGMTLRELWKDYPFTYKVDWMASWSRRAVANVNFRACAIRDSRISIGGLFGNSSS